MNSFFFLLALLVLIEEGSAQFGPFTQLAPGQTLVSGVLPTGGKLYYNFNGFPAGSCFGLREDATFDLVYGWFSDEASPQFLAYGDSQITGTASSAGNIKIGVTGWADTNFLGTHTRNGSFVMNLTVASATNDGDSTFATRVVLPSNQRSYLSNLYVPPTVFGSSCAGTADVDFVTFTLPVGACWSTQISRSFDEIFGLFAPNGTLIDVQDSSLRGIVDSTGQVNIAISGWNDNKFNGTHSYSGSYNLTIVTQTTGEQRDNTFETRQMLAPGVTVVTGDMWALTGNCQIGDVDFYDFQLTPGVCAQTSMVRNFDEIFGLFADNGTLLQTADSQISAKVPASGHWIIAVSGWNDNRFVGSHSYNGNYTLTINTFPTTQDGNNNFQTAVQVDGATTRSYVSTLESNTSPCSGAGDVDFVTFNNLPVGNCFYTLMNRNFDEILGWYDSNGAQISYSDTQIVGKVPSSGSVTIAVSAWADSNFIGSHTSSGNYNLTIVTVPPPASDGDDTFETRTKLAAGVSTYSSNLAALAAAPCNVIGDIDFLEFTATAGACFSTRVSSNFDDMLGWVADNGTILQVLDSSQVSGIVPQSGKLILAVTAYDDFALIGDHSRSGNYTLNVTVTVPQTDQSESPLSPQFAVAGVAVSGDLYPSNPACGGGDKDFFFYVLPAGSCFYTVQNVTFDEYMGAFFSNGTLFATNDNSLSGFVPSDGVVIIGITGYPDTAFTGAHSRSGTYRLTTFSEVVTPDGDSTFQTSKVQTTPTPVSGSISAYTHCSGGGDVDFITYTNLVPGSCYQTQIVSNFTSGQYILGLFADNGTQLDYTYSQFTNTVPASGRVTFAISGSGDTTFNGVHSSVGIYTLSLNITTNTVVNDGNNDFASATVLGNATHYSSDLYAFADNTPCSGDGGSSDVDFIQFTVKSKCDVTFTVDSSIDTYLGYYLENGTRAATTDSNDLTIKAPSSGIITFAITAWPDTSFTGEHSRSGNYNVTLGLDCGNAPDGFDRVTSGGAASGNLAAGQVDRWTFEGQIPGYCYVTNMDTSFDAVLGLYSDAGELIDWDDYSLMGIIPNSSQVNIAVSGWADTTFVGDHTRSGPYTLSLIVTHNEPPPPSDGNDSFQERIIVNGTQVSGSIWATIDQTPCPDDVNTRNDVDYYQFIGLPNGYCAATRMQETFDSALALLDNNGNIVEWEDYNIYTLVGSSGVVNIAVTGYPDRDLTGNHQKNGNYTLFIDLTHNDPAPASDGNNNFVFSTVVAGGGRTVSGSIWSLSDKTPCPNDFTAMGDVDYYRFGPYTAGDCFQTQVSSNFDEYLGWFNNQGELIDDEDYQITGIVPADGFLYIAVSGYPDRTFIGNHNHNGNYTLTINLSRNTPPPASDGNQSFNTSTVLAPGQVSVTGSIWATIDQTPCPNDHNTINDVDFYTFRGLQAGSCFQTTENADFDQVTGLFNNSGRLVDWADYTLTGVIPADGTLHIAVSGWADTTFVGNHQHNGNYTLALTITRNDEPGETADNTFVGRKEYAAGINKVSGDIWYIRDRTPCPNDLPPSDVDFFTYTGLPAGLCFRTSTDTNFDTILGWYGNDGLQLVWSDGEIYGVVPDDGVVHLAVSGWADWYFNGDHTNGGRYTITIILDEDCDSGGGSGGGQGQWCANNCAGKTCGSNGCGGSCGTCGAGLFCLTDGSCSSTCNTTCFAGQECGYNGCGGYCGTCSGAQDVCSGGLCTCVGDCSGRECGDDGCGGSCGRCAGNQDQCFDGLCHCVANCTHHECGDDGCGGICGTCGPYYTCGNSHTCVRDPLTQPSCDDYFGLPHQEVSLVLLNEVNSLLREKILETIDNLESMRDALLEYDPESQLLNLASLIDQIHLFCSGPYHNDTCLSLSELEFIETAFLNAIHVVTVDPMSECAGRVCGFTSYGGSCGSCPTGQECTEDGQCICSYSCEGRTCGNAFQEEGTSMTLCPPKSCGSCADRYECTNYNCTPVPHPPITVGLFDCVSQAPLGVNGNIDITGDNYMSTFQIPVGSNLTWVPEVQEGTFNFTFSALGYVGDSQEVEVEFTTTGIYFCLVRETVLIEIRDADLRTTINQPCSVNYTLQNIGDFTQTTPPNPFVHTIPDNGYGQYVFNVKCEGYDFRSEVNTIDPNTNIVYINVQRTPIKLMILDCESSIYVNVQQTLQISSTFDLYVQVYDIPKNSYVEWVPPQIGTYDFMTSAIGYESSGESRTIDYTTTELQFCISRSTFLVGVQDINTKAYVTAACTITYNPPPPNGRATSITPPNPVSITVPDDGYGLWNWKTTCQGYLESNVDLAVNDSTTLLILFVTPPPVTIDVRDIYTNTTIGTSALINYDGVASGSFNWNGPTLFQHYGFGAYTFTVHPDTLYQNSTTSVTISATTTTVILYVSPRPIQVDVRDRYTDTSITVGATINYSGAHSGNFRWNGVTLFQHQGYGTYTFVAQPDSIYGSGSVTVTINVSTTSVIIYVSPPAVQIDVRDRINDVSIGVGATINYSGVASGSFRWNGITSFNHSGYGTYTFAAQPDSLYGSGSMTVSINTNTTLVIIYVSPAPLQIDVRDRLNNASISIASTINYSGVSTGSFRWNGITSFEPTAYGSYTFVAQPDSVYQSGSVTVTINVDTTLVIIYVSAPAVQIDVRDRTNNASIRVAATINYSGVASGSFRWNGITSFQPTGYGSYSFIALPDSSYASGTTSLTISSTTTLIIIYVEPNTVQIDIRERTSNTAINVGATVTYSGVVSGSFKWTGLYTFQHGGYGSYTFSAVPDSTYSNGSSTVQISSSTTLIIIYVEISEFCGNGICAGTETASNCFADCVSLFFEFENADGSGPVNGPTVNLFLSNPRDANSNTGPNKNNAQVVATHTTGNASNTVLDETASYGTLVYIESVVSGFINFYWVANTSNVDPQLGVYRLRVHLSRTLGANDFNYRFVNTWKPIDADPQPYGPTDLNLHLFYSSGALDINNAILQEGGFSIGVAVADSKQSGGPATMDISPASNILIGIWNSKPPRNNAIAPSQNSRHIVDSGSYVVVYGKTSNSATGKQVGQYVLDQLLMQQPALKSDVTSDLWYAGTFTVSQPGSNQPTFTPGNKLKAATISSSREMFFDCEVYAYCNNFRVPYSDTGRRSVEDEE